ncbi:MAG: long-chain fatty acid--CoA ligase [Acidobacteriota bacterium]|nr:long-chain fatty acid--CoA ligase [Acidobacteriota bacterium]
MQFRNLAEMFLHYVRQYDRPDALYVKRHGQYRPISTREFYDHVVELAHFLRSMYVQPGDRVAILSENRPEWFYADMATLSIGGASVPIYATLPPGQVAYILQDAQTVGVFVSTLEQLAKIESIAADLAAFLRFVVLFEEAGDYRPALPAAVQFFSLERAMEVGRQDRARQPDWWDRAVASVQSEDLATIIYTSGTTGEPKGVMLTHRNFLSNIEAVLQVLSLGPSDVHLSFLPLSHVFERMAGYYTMLTGGARVAFAESIDKVAENLLEIRPTVIIAVPRFYEKVKARIDAMARQLTGLRKRLFEWALRVADRVGEQRRAGRPVPPWLALQYALADRLVYHKIKARTGGRVRTLVSGGAALRKDSAIFFDNLGLRILEGYGLTETSPVISVNTPTAWKPGSVGRPIPGVEVKIAADGEILTRGPHVMKGYFRRPEATQAAIDPEGWFHTGDIGELDPDGFLYITDRKKDILVTAGGKNIAPQKIENLLKQSPWIEEVMVVGDGRPYPAAFIVPNRERLVAWAQEKGLPVEPYEEFLRHPTVIQLYEQILQDLQTSLARFEQVKRFVLLPQSFTIEAGELTPTLKVRRRIVMEKYEHLIRELYPEEVTA